MPNVYFAGLFAVLILLGIGGAYVKGRSDGTAIATSTYAQRDLKSANDYAAKTKEITDSYRAKETAWASQSAAVSMKYQKGLADNATTYLTLLTTAPVLRDPNAAECKASGSGSAETPASASGRNGAPGANLPKATGDFLLGLASEADAVTIQLGACQDVLEGERR